MALTTVNPVVWSLVLLLTQYGRAALLEGEPHRSPVGDADMSTTISDEPVIWSGGNAVPMDEQSLDWTQQESPEPWQFSQFNTLRGSVTSSFENALCMEVAAEGVNIGSWFSPYSRDRGGIDLVNNNVYRCQFDFVTDQTSVGKTPLISMIISNFDPDGGGFGGPNVYHGVTFILDHFGGQNAPLSSGSFGRESHWIWFTPPPVLTPQWRDPMTGIFTAGNDTINDMRIRFDVLDIDGTSWLGGEDFGKVCLTRFDIDRFNLDDKVIVETLYDAQELTDAIADPINGAHLAVGFDSQIEFSDGNVTLRPLDADAGWTNELVGIVPGDTNFPFFTGGPELEDNYPVPWGDECLYEITASFSAPDELSEISSPDMIRIGIDNPTQELIGLGNVTANLMRIGMPKMGEPQIYTAFFHANSVTLSEVPGHRRLRPRIDVICHGGLFNGTSTNFGGVTIHSMTVNKVRF